MWFRNLLLYRLTAPFELSAEQLHAQLQARAFRPCSGLEAHTLGWEAPLGREAQALTHAANGRILVCARREERILPAAVVREALEDKVSELEAAEARPLRRKEKLQLKDEIVTDLLPRAFTRSHRLYAYIDPAEGWLVVDSATAKRAEELLALLRESLGSLPLVPLQVDRAPARIMTGWLEHGAPPDFELQDECELREPLENGGIVRCRRQALDGNEVATHLDAGKQAVRLAVAWQ
ncbi:MAG: recombination associated protein RdgC, partial [Pseudomonadota bacterium]